jgi:L-aminoadipate-semialdehyde dehydrogenase
LALNRPSHIAQEAASILQRLGVARCMYQGGVRVVRSPLTGEAIANVHDADAAAIGNAIAGAARAFRAWRLVPAPRRGERVRLLAEAALPHRADRCDHHCKAACGED